MKALFEKLDKSSVKELPLLIMDCKTIDNKKVVFKNPIDSLVEKRKATYIKTLIYYMKQSDENGVLYQ